MSRLLITLLLCLGAQAAAAQDPVASTPPVAWGMWGGLARNSPTNLWGAEGGRDIGVLAVRVARELSTSDRLAVEFVADLVPAAWVTMPRRDSVYMVRCEKPMPGELCRRYEPFTRVERARGFGAAPLGFQVRFSPSRRVQPYVALSGGMLRFGEVIPVRGGAKLNFTADAGAGLLVALPRGMGLLVGYKFYHISNGGTAYNNPGLDGHMVALGLRAMSR